MKVIGLTGGIATGKSTVSRYLSKNGIPIIDADLIAREIVQPGTPALKAIVGEFGHHMLLVTGELDRKALGKHVFSNKEALASLNAITHPIIRKTIEERIRLFEADRSCRAVIIDAALLIETGLNTLVDDVWLVVVDQETQVSRLTERNKITREEALKIMGNQYSTQDKKKQATVFIDNKGSLADLYHQLDELIITIS